MGLGLGSYQGQLGALGSHEGQGPGRGPGREGVRVRDMGRGCTPALSKRNTGPP